MVGAFSVHGPHAFLGSNEATYGLREGGAGFHRNRPTGGSLDFAPLAPAEICVNADRVGIW
jgi:hypothetical protein